MYPVFNHVSNRSQLLIFLIWPRCSYMNFRHWNLLCPYPTWIFMKLQMSRSDCWLPGGTHTVLTSKKKKKKKKKKNFPSFYCIISCVQKPVITQVAWLLQFLNSNLQGLQFTYNYSAEHIHFSSCEGNKNRKRICQTERIIFWFKISVKAHLPLKLRSYICKIPSSKHILQMVILIYTRKRRKRISGL